MQMLLVIRVSDALPGNVAIGSKRGKCGRCREPVWLAPSSQPALRTGARVVCSRCLKPAEVKRMKLRILPGQAEEVAAHFAGRN